MKFELFKRVARCEDLPQHSLRKGDVATVIDYHPASDEDGYSLEVFNPVGDTIAVLTVAASQIEPLLPNEVLHVRALEEAAR